MRFTFILLVFLSANCFSQTMESFFKEKGIEMLAFFAHPTNNYKSGKVEIKRSEVKIKIYYQDYVTDLVVKRDRDVFYDIKVTNDSDWATPFSAISFIKNKIGQYLQENPRLYDNKTKFEKYMQRKVIEMDGVELSSLLLTLSWLDY